MAAADTNSRKVYLSTINPHIACGICDGYLIDATTVDECLHSFCRSCLIQHIRTGTHCPVENCGTVINKVKPNIKLDTTLQAIVYKLVPGLYEKEILCRRAFYRFRKEEAQQATPEQRGDDTEHLIFAPNENISLMLEYSDNDSNLYRSSDDENSDSGSSELKSNHHNSDDEIDSQLRVPKYLQCPAIFRISNLKKFVMHKFGIDPNKFCVEIMYKVKMITLPDDWTLMDVAYIYTWKRDAPMKFLYCVRAATKENVALPNVDNLMRPSAEYLNAKNAYLNSLRIRDTDHEQSSDADSDMRSESGVSSSAVAPAAPVVADVATTRAVNGNANSGNKHETEISTTITTTTTATNRTNNSPTTARTKNTVAATTTTNTKTPLPTAPPPTSTATSNGKETNCSVSQAQTNPKPSLKRTEDNAERTPTDRPAATSSEAVQRLSATPSQTNSPRNASEQPTKTNGNDKPADSLSTSPPSSSRSSSNFGVEMTKEKVKIKIVSLKPDTNSLKPATSTESSGHPSSPASSSSRQTSTPPKNDSAEPPAKSKFLLSKDKETKPKSASNAEAEYDFDQHLLEEKLTEKNQFLKSIHLAPRTAAEMQDTKSPSKIEPKNDQPTDSTKDVKPSTPSVSAGSAPSTKNPSPASTSPTARTSSPQAPIDVDKDPLRRPEIKASKRKSREPVKNVTKLKCPPPTSIANDSIRPQSATVSNNGGGRMISPSLQHNDRDAMSLKATDHEAMTLKTALNMSEQNKISLSLLKKQHQQQHLLPQRQPTLKRPTTSESSSSGSGKEANKSAKSETSIIINDVQRPNQADTPRPAFNHNMIQSFSQPKHHHHLAETEIKEIGHDAAKNIKVYGPPSYDSHHLSARPQYMKNLAATKRSFNSSNQNEPLLMNAPLYLPYYSHLSQQSHKKLKPKSGHSSSSSSSSISPGPIDMKKKLNSTGELEVTTSKSNAMPKRQSDSNNVHKLLHNCNITLPKSLSVTLTNDDEMESNRSFFNQKKTPVNNSIEIVKLPDESTSPSPVEQTNYAKAQSNSPSLQTNNHSGSGSASPVPINLVSSKSMSTTKHKSNSSSPVPGTSHAGGFQAEYEATVNPKKKISKPFPMFAPASPAKRKHSPNGPGAYIPNRLLPRPPASKLSPQSSGWPSPPSANDIFLQLQSHRANFANHQGGGNRGSGGNGGNQTSYMSIPTSSRPI